MAGLGVLLRGGNAVDAAIAVGATIAVVYPHMTGLGGDSFWLVWDARGRRLRVLAACGASAAAASPALYRARGLAAIPARGPLAALTVPGAVDGLWEAHRLSRTELGSPVPWADLLADAIRHAAEGVAVSPCQARITAAATDLQAGTEPWLAPLRDTYLGGGAPLAPGAPLRQPRLARTLERLARDGGRAFYEGPIAAEIERACTAAGSPIRAGDLARHHSRWVDPVTAPYRGGLAASAPPPSQGFATLAILGMLEAGGCAAPPVPDEDPPAAAEHVHAVVEATKLAFADRDRWLADPEAVSVPVDRLLDPDYLRTRAGSLSATRAAPVALGAPGAGGDTIACVVADGAGNCVSLIQSLYHEWGSGLVAGETGVVLQNRGAFFSLDPAQPNALAPGKRPGHTLTPFMWLRQGRPVLVGGTMGGEGQPQTLAALTTRVVDAGLDLQTAVEAPRWVYGRTWGAPTRALAIEARFPPAVADALAARGHPVEVIGAWSDRVGHAQAIRLDYAAEEVDLLTGAGDPRADGPALAA
jgi:gamma-glutamyltranspeptidase/glutathione hydrolase